MKIIYRLFNKILKWLNISMLQKKFGGILKYYLFELKQGDRDFDSI